MGAQAVRLSNGDIDNALKNKDFEVLFQPIFDLGNGALARVETFIRWRHPSLGVLPPGAFISFFESQGRMSELTRYVLGEALGAYISWRGPHAPGFSINLALSDLSDEAFPSHFAVLLRDHNFPAEFVTLECPMPAVEADTQSTARQLQRLASTGARLAIEVRGRATDFLKTVSPFPFAEIKTGGAAILRFARTVRGPGLSAISELLELAAQNNAAITAVGVEDQASLSALRGLGFAAAQGNHLGKVGALNHFMPSHVNDVRTLLGLEALSNDDLVALFRTGAPTLSPAVADGDDEKAQDEATGSAADTDGIEFEAEPARREAASDDELVERLAARIAKADDEPAADGDREGDDVQRARAKAAAIARAKRNSIAREKLAARNALKEKAEARNEAPAPRDMQNRISREFGAASDDAPEYDPQTDEMAATIAEPAEMEAAPEVDPGPPPAVQFDARLAVRGARARFNPPIRVKGEAAAAEDITMVGAMRAARKQNDIGDLHAETPPAEAPAAAVMAEEIEDAIPEPMASAQWLEEIVETEVDEPAEESRDAARPKRAKSFLKRTLVPYSALKITHFWPRPARKRAEK